MTPDLSIITTTTLNRGAHPDKPGACALEVYNLALGFAKSDHVPDCAPSGLALLPVINDWAGWKDDAERTEFMRPYLLRLASFQRDPVKDLLIAYRHADYVVRVIAARAMDAGGIAYHALRLRALAPVVDKETAEAAESAARAAWAAAAVAEAAAAARAAWAARAEAADAARSDFTALLDIICDVYEEGTPSA